MQRLWQNMLSDDVSKIFDDKDNASFNNCNLSQYVDMQRFDITNDGYRALLSATREVWGALDTRNSATDALRRTTRFTADIHVPSRTGWDVATSLHLPAGEVTR